MSLKCVICLLMPYICPGSPICQGACPLVPSLTWGDRARESTGNYNFLLPPQHSLMAASLLLVWLSDLCNSKGDGAIHLRNIMSETGRGMAASSAKDLCICHRREVWTEKWLPEVLELEEAALLPFTVSSVFIWNLCYLRGPASRPFLPSLNPFSLLDPFLLHSLFWLSAHVKKKNRAELARCTLPGTKL